MSLPRPRAILFDWDSTLIDAWPAIGAALNETLVAMGHAPWTDAETRLRVRESMRDSFPKLFGERWTEAREVFYARYNACHLEHLAVLPGAADVLATLKGQGIYLGVVSNKRGDLLRHEAAHLGWIPHFGRLVGAGDAVRDKPDPAPIAMALEPSGIAPGREVWFVGDTGIDMACARNAGCIPVLVGDLDPESSEFRDARPEWHARDFATLRGLVAGP
jgi:phosphoglycolate phosphatase